jgi:hypothetical protein
VAVDDQPPNRGREFHCRRSGERRGQPRCRPVGSVVDAHAVTKSVASKRSSWTITTGRDL